MDLNDVLAFVRVVEQGGFSAAARGLGVPPSTISRRVARLEDHLGVRLMQRTTRRQHLTDAGRIFYDRSAHVAEDLLAAERAVAEMQAAPRGRLRVTAPEDVGVRGWGMIGGFLDAFPEVEIELYLEQRFVDIVGEGFDVALRGGTLVDASLVARKLSTTEQVMVASPAYLANAPPLDKVEDIVNHDCVQFPAWTPRGTWTLNGADGPVTLAVHGRVTVNHLSVVQTACVAGFGVGLALRMNCEELLESGALVELLPGACTRMGDLWLLYPSRRHLSPAVRAFIDYAVEHWSD